NLPPKRPKCPSWSGSTAVILKPSVTLYAEGYRLVALLDGGMRTRSDEIGDRGAGIAAGHQGFTDEDDIGPGARELDYIMRTADAGFRHPDQVGRDQRRDPGEGGAVHLERLQVPVVHTDQLRAGVNRTPSLLLVVHLDQRG